MEQKEKEDEVTLVKRGKIHTLVSLKASSNNAQRRLEKTSEPQAGLSRRTVLTGLLGILALVVAYKLEKKVSGSGGKTERINSDDSTDEIQRLKNRAESVGSQNSPFDFITHDLSQVEKGVARSIVDEMRYEVLEKHPSFDGMMAVTRKFEGNIREAAQAFNFPEDLALGIVFIENGGAEDLTSPAGARTSLFSFFPRAIKSIIPLSLSSWKPAPMATC